MSRPTVKRPAVQKSVRSVSQRPSIGAQRTGNGRAPPQNERSLSTERTVQIGSGFQMFAPAPEKRERIRAQAEKEQQDYQNHLAKSRPKVVHEIHRLGGGKISLAEARRRQAENYQSSTKKVLPTPENSAEPAAPKNNRFEKEIQFLRQILTDVDEQTLISYLEIFNGDVESVMKELQ